MTVDGCKHLYRHVVLTPLTVDGSSDACMTCGVLIWYPSVLDEDATNITPDVAVEIRAAEIAAGGHEIAGGKLRSMSWEEGAGWDGFETDTATFVDEFGAPCNREKWLTGWLAREISTRGAPR